MPRLLGARNDQKGRALNDSVCLINQAATKMWRGEASKMPKFERKIKIKQPPDEYPFLQASLRRTQDYQRAFTRYFQVQLPGPKNSVPPAFRITPGRLRLLVKFLSASLGPCSHWLPSSSNTTLCQTCPELYQRYLESWHSYRCRWVPEPTYCHLRLCHPVDANWGGYGTRQLLARLVVA